MRTLLFLLPLLMVIASSCKKSNTGIRGSNRVKIDTAISHNFYDDAVELYLREIYRDSLHKNYNDPVLDTNEINKILEIIQTVYKSQSPERDTVFDIYNIHAFKCTSTKSISIAATINAPEIKNLANRIIPTGNTTLDKILSDYKFDSVYKSPYYPEWTSFLYLYTTKTFNLIPIEKQLQTIPSIFIVERGNGCIGGGNDIILGRDKDSATIAFSIGWGDCPAGCINERFWYFTVANNQAEFIKVIQR